MGLQEVISWVYYLIRVLKRNSLTLTLLHFYTELGNNI